MTPHESALVAAIRTLRQAYDTLGILSEHPAFADDAVEFNRGGVGYEARRAIERVIYGSAP